MNKNYWDYDNFPSKTKFEEKEPRLLLISMDPLNSKNTVTFDNYEKEDAKCKTTYKIKDNTYSITYDEISIDHVIARMCTHLRYKYPLLSTNVTDSIGKNFTEILKEVLMKVKYLVKLLSFQEKQ